MCEDGKSKAGLLGSFFQDAMQPFWIESSSGMHLERGHFSFLSFHCHGPSCRHS
jgi:hypothetical protein